MRIKSIQLNQVGVFEDETIEFKPCPSKGKAEIHIFTGTNGTGKSTILKALAAGFEPPNELSTFNFSDNNFGKYFRKDNGTITPKFEHGGTLFSHENDDYREYSYAQFSSKKITKNLIFCALAYSSNRQISKTQNQDGHFVKSENPLYKALTFDKLPNQNFSIPAWLTQSLLKRGYAKAEKIKVKEDLHNDIIKNIEDLIFQITNQKINFKLDSNLKNTVLHYGGVDVEFDVLPDGLKSIISWIADMCMILEDVPWENDTPIFERNIILLLDEIEVHLHIEWQRKILPAIQKLFPNAQIFISTHSPFVVNSVDDAWVYNLEVKNGNAKVRKVELSQDGKSITSILRNIFGVKEVFGLAVEKDLKVFRTLIDKALDKSISAKEIKELDNIAKKLVDQGTETASIVGFEMRQLERLNKKELAI